MKIVASIAFSGFLLALTGCNPSQIEAKREGLLPIKETAVRSFQFQVQEEQVRRPL